MQKNTLGNAILGNKHIFFYILQNKIQKNTLGNAINSIYTRVSV